MKPAWQRGPIEDAGSQTIAKFDHMSSKPRHVWQGWFLSHEKNKFIFMDHPELCISNCKLEVVKAPEPAKLHKLVWRRKTTCGSPVASSMHMRNDMPQNDITFV